MSDRVIQLQGRGARGPAGFKLLGSVTPGQFIVKAPGTDSTEYTLASGTGSDSALRTDLAAGGGAGLAGYTPGGTYSGGSVGGVLNTVRAKAPWLAAQNGGAYNYLASATSLYNYARGSGVGISSFARTSDTDGGANEISIGKSSAVINDILNKTTGAWGDYITVARDAAGVLGSTIGKEIDVFNGGDNITITPMGASGTGITVGLWVAAGGEQTFAPYSRTCAPITAGLVFLSNDPSGAASMGAAIVVKNGALTSPGGMFAQAPLGASLVWYDGARPAVGINGGGFSQTIQSDGQDCYNFGTTRVKADGTTWGSGTQLFRHDIWNHLGGTNTDSNVSIRAINLDARAAAYQIIVRNTDNGTTGIGLSQGTFVPLTDNAISLGAPGARWQNSYNVTGAWSTSDEKTKKLLGPLPASVLAAGVALLEKIQHWQALDSIAAKGEDAARFHISPSAQDIIAAFEAQGEDAFKWGVVGKDLDFKQVDILGDIEEPVYLTRPKLVHTRVYNSDGTVTVNTIQDGTEEYQPIDTFKVIDTDGKAVMYKDKNGNMVQELDEKPRTQIVHGVVDQKTVPVMNDDNTQSFTLCVRDNETNYLLLAALASKYATKS